MIHLKSYLIIVAHFKIDIYFIKHKSLKNITISSMLTYTDIIPFITDSSDKHFFFVHTLVLHSVPGVAPKQLARHIGPCSAAAYFLVGKNKPT